jgi:hypothetical protein
VVEKFMGVFVTVGKESWSEARSQIVSAGINALWPWVLAAMTIASNFMGGGSIPLPYLIAATTFVFATTTIGIFYFQKLLSQQSAEEKLLMSATIMGKRYEKKDGVDRLVGIKYIVAYNNSAHFPIDFEVIPKRVSLGGSINEKPLREITGSSAPAGAQAIFIEAEVPVLESMKGKLIEGVYEFELKYGRKGRTRRYIKPYLFRYSLTTMAKLQVLRRLKLCRQSNILQPEAFHLQQRCEC